VKAWRDRKRSGRRLRLISREGMTAPDGVFE
jgi:hypothetical protein